jgi:hypothetical protein
MSQFEILFNASKRAQGYPEPENNLISANHARCLEYASNMTSWCSVVNKDSYLSSLWKAGFWTKNASKKAWFNIHMIDNSFFKF